jgi:EmrB/QacA subfamily drug resistance transporter
MAIDPTAPPSRQTNRFGILGSMSDRAAVATIFVVAMFMDIMDGTIVNTALPSIGKDFGATSPSSLAWVVLGYLLSLAIWIPASGWLGDKYGTKKIFLFALFTFTVASVLCGQAHSIGELTAFRFLQGIGGGMMTPVGTTMLFREYPPHERAKASAILVVPTLMAPALGPVLGGYLTDGLGWRWIFYVNAPFGIAAFCFGLWRLKEYQHHASSKFDPAGFVLSATSLGAILYALNQAELVGWSSARVLGFLIGGALLGVALVVVETKVHDPILALRLFKESVFRTTNLTSIFATGSFFGLVLLVPLMLQTVRGLSAAQSGLTTFPQALGVILMSQVVRKLYPKVGPRRLLVVGLTIAGLVMLTLEWTSATSSLWDYRLILSR